MFDVRIFNSNHWLVLLTGRNWSIWYRLGWTSPGWSCRNPWCCHSPRDTKSHGSKYLSGNVWTSASPGGKFKLWHRPFHASKVISWNMRRNYTRRNSSTTLGPVDMYPVRLHTTDRLNVYSPSNKVIWQLRCAYQKISHRRGAFFFCLQEPFYGHIFIYDYKTKLNINKFISIFFSSVCQKGYKQSNSFSFNTCMH